MAVIQDQESILRKIRAMIARAEHPNTPKPEAEVSRNQAEKLMAKYSINAALIGDVNGGKTKPSDFKFDIFGSYQGDRAILINGIAKVFNCHLIQRRSRTEGVDFQIFGFEADLDMVWTLWESIDRQCTDALFSMSGSVSFKKSFMDGYTSQIVSRLTDFYAKEVAEAEESSPGTELILANRADEVERHMRSVIGNVQKGRARQRRGDYGGYASGKDAGAKADIGLNGNKLANQGAISV